MIFTKNFFGKEDIENVLFDDVLDFFETEREENNNIEFKSYIENQKEGIKGNERGVLKAICGFLNSDGGLLIWGAPKGEYSSEKSEKIFKGELSLVKVKYEKDQFINKVSDNITPLPRNIKFHSIENNGKYLYLIEIGKSEYAPHQFKNQYYMRMDGQTKPAPHHYVEALFARIKYPNLKGFIGIDNWNWRDGGCKLNLSVWLWNFSQFQNASDISYKLICDVGKFEGNGGFKDKNASFERQDMVINRIGLVGSLSFGSYFRQRERMTFIANDLRLKNDILRLRLVFGSKESPSLKSDYTIDLSLDESIHGTFNHHIIEMNENALLLDLDLKEEKDRVGKILGRPIQ